MISCRVGFSQDMLKNSEPVTPGVQVRQARLLAQHLQPDVGRIGILEDLGLGYLLLGWYDDRPPDRLGLGLDSVVKPRGDVRGLTTGRGLPVTQVLAV